MKQQQLKFKKLHPKAKLPTRGSISAAGYDLYSPEKVTPQPKPRMISFGISVEIPEGYCGLLVERSSNHKRGLSQVNKIGIIDSDYRGELKVPMHLHTSDINVGDRIAQLVVVPIFQGEPIWADDLEDTERGEGSFGSTGT